MKTIEFINPIEGDMLHARDGIVVNGSLQTIVKIKAPLQHLLTINGVEAQEREGVFEARIILNDYQNTIEVKNMTTGENAQITVFWLPRFAGNYRLSIDDNIWFLRDIHQNEDKYTSIFDNPYLGFLKEVHDTYGTKVHFNLFYETDGFNLSQLTDKYKSEWTANADWIRLSFHALGEFPDMPYRNASYQQVAQDCELVKNEIRRFAGEAVMGPVTTIHWGEANVEGSRALRDAGYVGQLGYFNVDDDLPAVSYYLTVEQRRRLKKRFVWHDTAENITFIRSSIVVDKKELDEIVPHLNYYEQLPSGQPPYVDFLVHEQYFYPFYEAYQPDFRERIVACVKWATHKGYTPAFLGDCIL
ncbi:hypothetical protein P1X15_00680 [Runella sp. MFBS21]|uniref:hypothetical protein n=1 Tax=Runella sp. MFBS21 TaxID=3034018 RepID=UPI0023F652BB|nr:hypothetical protein [Runella sp. MFBS21]MDF7816077.1 hypothetical protein [Runella sp. MFBS21]